MTQQEENYFDDLLEDDIPTQSQEASQKKQQEPIQDNESLDSDDSDDIFDEEKPKKSKPAPKKQSDLMELGGLWKNTSKSGKIYYASNIKVGNSFFKVIVTKNTQKTKDTHPDLIFSVAPSNYSKEDK